MTTASRWLAEEVWSATSWLPSTIVMLPVVSTPHPGSVACAPQVTPVLHAPVTVMFFRPTLPRPKMT
jgi:hypothetical protein